MCGGTWPPLHGEPSTRTDQRILLDGADDLIDAKGERRTFQGPEARKTLAQGVSPGGQPPHPASGRPLPPWGERARVRGRPHPTHGLRRGLDSAAPAGAVFSGSPRSVRRLTDSDCGRLLVGEGLPSRFDWRSGGVRRLAGSPCHVRGASYFDFATSRWLVTEKTPETPLARRLARFLSPSLSTTPSRVTFPFLTIIRMGLMTGMAYRSSAG